MESYEKIVALVKSSMQDRVDLFHLTPEQTRTKFKSCVAACKEAAMTRRNGSGIENLMQNQRNWFQKLLPFEASRDSCNPSLAQEPSFEIRATTVDEIDGEESSNSETNYSSYSEEESSNVEKRNICVPVPRKRIKMETTSAILKETISALNRFAAADPSEAFMKFLREENERSRAHEREMAEMQMRMLQKIMTTPSYPHPYQHPFSQQHIANNQNVPSSFSSSNNRGGHGIHTIPRHEDSHTASSN